MFDLQVPFFLPVWRRVAVIVVCTIWGLFELSTNNPLWAVLFCGIAAYSTWQFFFDGWPEDNKPDQSSSD